MYIIFPDRETAKDRSRLEWEYVLGHTKNPEDVTEFLWQRIVGIDGRTALNTGDVPVTRRNGPDDVVETLDPVNWPSSNTIVDSL